MRVLIVPDSFKGSLSAVEVCEVVASALRRAGHDPVSVPVADGGEGTLEAMEIAADARIVVDTVSGPFGQAVRAKRGWLRGDTAIVELAQAAGLGLVGDDLRAGDTSTFGVGEQIRAATEDGAQEIIVAIGGSATNDGGCGAAVACGVRFLDEAGEEFVPVGASLSRIASIDTSQMAITGARIVAMCDVDNPLTGEQGASAVFGPQKGADPKTVTMLDEGLAHLARVIQRDLGVDIERLAGAGAAGGMGGGLVAFFGAELRRGIDVVLDAVRFDDLLQEADAVITGEGSFDEQSMRGKVIHGVALRAARAGVPVHVLAGRVDDAVDVEALGLASATAITPPDMPLKEAMANAASLLSTQAMTLAERLGS